MTAEQLQQIRARCNAASPGPWSSHALWEMHDGKLCENQTECVVCQHPDVPSAMWIASHRHTNQQIDFSIDEPPISEGLVGLRPNDADFIAHARTDVPALLDEIARLRQALTEEREACAVVAENAWHGDIPTYTEREVTQRTAAAIRERGKRQ